MRLLELNHEKFMDILPDRDPQAHKGDFGRILLLCGSRGYTGAAALAALGALRCGAGLVYLGVPESIYTIVATKLLEPVVFPLSDKNGMFAADSTDLLSEKLKRMDAVLIGPGVGLSEGSERVLTHVLTSFNGPIVIDADGINLLKAHKDILRGRTAPVILTPHEGEFARFTGCPITDRVRDAAELAGDLGVIVLLKGRNSVITDGSVCYINPTGNPGMAVGGSGDVLAGMITALLGQGISPLEAAACGAWLHGAAGDICAQELGQYGMLPSDMIHVLPRLLK